MLAQLRLPSSVMLQPSLTTPTWRTSTLLCSHPPPRKVEPLTLTRLSPTRPHSLLPYQLNPLNMLSVPKPLARSGRQKIQQLLLLESSDVLSHLQHLLLLLLAAPQRTSVLEYYLVVV